MAVVSSLSETVAAIGDNVTINGSSFGASQGAGKVMLGQVMLHVVSWSDTAIVVTIPPGVDTGSIYVFIQSVVDGGVITIGSTPVSQC